MGTVIKNTLKGGVVIYQPKAKVKEIVINFNLWDLNFIEGLIDYELHNTDGHTPDEYDRMEQLIKNLRQYSQIMREEGET